MPVVKELLKLKAASLSPIARHIKWPVMPQKSPLVMTLLVRNEEDIVRANLNHHFSQGVDYIIATDNNSDDGTREILAEFQQQGRLYLIDEPEKNYAQAAWLNRMANIAFQKFGACFIFHADADEFWCSQSGNLKNELAQHPLLDCLEVTINNTLLLFDDFNELFPNDATLVINNPLHSDNLEEDSRNRSMYLYPYPQKVFYRAKRFMPTVEMGNHGLENKKIFTRKQATDVHAYHFPIRGYKQFETKVINSGAALNANTDLPLSFGWHMRRWHKAYQEGRLKDEYRLLIFNQQQAQELEQKGIARFDTSLSSSFNIPAL